ncbi:hypothetical protein HZ326_26176 [Fusarium oxysporum f. sp. albedinis]|nr:hypothetical protein HZ326_26176 [Fusarium oxysporum f. sp. albedinis]
MVAMGMISPKMATIIIMKMDFDSILLVVGVPPTQECRPEMRRIPTSAPIRISIFLPRISPLEMRRNSIWVCKPRTRNAPRFFHEGPCQPCRRPRS